MMRTVRNKPEEGPADYSHWHREHDQWEQDISRWQADHQSALIELERIARLFVEHGEALRRHAIDIEGHKQASTAIERSGWEASFSEITLDWLTASHRKYGEVHDRIRRHHDNAVALMRALEDALRAAM